MNARVLRGWTAAAFAAAAGAAIALEPRQGFSPVNEQGPAAVHLSVAEDFARTHPLARFYREGERVTRVYGPAFSEGEDAVSSANAFLRRFAGVLGVQGSDLFQRTLSEDGVMTIPLMPDGNGGMKFTLVGYGQHRDGVEVYRSHVRALVRNEPGNPLVLVTNATFDLGDFQVDRAVAENPNFAAADAAIREALPAVKNGIMGDYELVIYAGTLEAQTPPVLALSFVAKTHESTISPGFGAWRVIADAATGRVISTENMICNADVTGRVRGIATQGLKSAECNEEASIPLKDLRVTSGAATTFTDAAGNYTLDLANGPATISGSPRGIHFRVFNPSADAPAISVNATAPGAAPDIVLNAANTSEMARAEVNAYHHHVVVRDFILAASPNYPTISTQTEWRINVGVSGTCNAFYFPNDSTNFFNAGGGCPNTAYNDIVHHEYGHHLVNTGGSLQDQYGEGMSDVMGVLITDQPVLAFGFFNDCNNGLRDARTLRTYPCNGGFHDCGMLISGCVWDTRNVMVSAGITDYRTILARLAVNAVPLHAGQGNIAPDITIDWLTLDDTDGDITNGTPHYAEINAGFSLHNMNAPPLTLATFDFPEGLPTSLRPNTTQTVRVRVAGLAATPIDGNASLVSKLPGQADVITPMQRIGVNEYIATLPATPCLDRLSFAFLAATTGGNARSPVGTGYYTALSAGQAIVKYGSDFATNDGTWLTSETVPANPGGWERGIPQASSGAPSADFGGDGFCYVTGLAPGEDIDGQSVRLYTRGLDTRGGLVYLSYARWLSNNTGPNPGGDSMSIEVSSNGGIDFTRLDRAGPTGPEAVGGWIFKNFELPANLKSDRFYMRITVGDGVLDSTVEAAFDSVRVTEFGCVTCAPDFNGDGFLDFFDYGDYVACFEGNCPPGKNADFNGDGFADFFDYADFVTAFEAGC
jgi:hypothetical protein